MPVTCETRLIPTTIRGRVLVRPATGAPAGILAGFHGYMENADIQMERLAAVAGESWTLISVQALHRFYKGRSEQVAASWMVRQDRDAMIADNIAYVDAALASIDRAAGIPVVVAGFSQGVAMAFRAAVRGGFGAAGVIAVGGDVPPELLADAAARFPPVLLIRGGRDDWYTGAKQDADSGALTSRGVEVDARTVPGGHDWPPEGDVQRAARSVLSRWAPPGKSTT